ncbi:MAG: hypothetical protein ACKV2T_25020 [Kofleriaceae bacterium]
MSSLRVVVFGVVTGAFATAIAGPVSGKLDLPPPPDRPPPATKGFLDRVENPLAPAKPVAVTPSMIVVLEGDAKPSSPGQVTWELVGESFARPVMGAPAGSEVVIKNTSRTARTLVAAEDPKLVQAGPINPTGTKSFRVPEGGKVYSIGDADAPHLRGKLVVTSSPYVALVDEAGKFDFGEVAEGSYKLKVFYKDRWLEGATDVNVGNKGKVEVNPKVPALVQPAKK